MLVIVVVILLVLVFCFRFDLLCFVFLFFFIFFRYALRPTIVVCLYLMYTIRASDGRARGTARLKTVRV